MPQFGTHPGLSDSIADETTRQGLLKWFFDVYLYRAALPTAGEQREGQDAQASTGVTPDNLPFPMPVDVRVDGEDGNAADDRRCRPERRRASDRR